MAEMKGVTASMLLWLARIMLAVIAIGFIIYLLNMLVL